MSDSASAIEALERTRAHLSERLQVIQAESEQSLENAQQAERDAASLYDALSRLDVPRFGRGVSSLDRQDLAAAAHVISLADLLAA